MIKHTPTPWMVTGKQTIRAGAKFSAAIGKTNWRNGEANAAFIVRAVNSHAMLLEAMERAADMLPANAACGVLRAALAKVKES
ncbi:MAG: hypothetical protein WC829_01010 [Hyphomicrobium sp.]|jgi:hypothetical protein